MLVAESDIMEASLAREVDVAVTIRDVAAAAGVSLTTVSHALSNQGRIGEKTRQRVLNVAAELGYRANVHAQQLVTNRSRTIAIQVAPFDPTSKSSTLIPNSEYFLEVSTGRPTRPTATVMRWSSPRRGSGRRRSARSRSTARSSWTPMATKGC